MWIGSRIRSQIGSRNEPRIGSRIGSNLRLDLGMNLGLNPGLCGIGCRTGFGIGCPALYGIYLLCVLPCQKFLSFVIEVGRMKSWDCLFLFVSASRHNPVT